MKSYVKTHSKSTALLAAMLLTIVALVPFHAFFTTWAGSNTGGLLVWRAWKELLLVPILCIATALVLADKSLRLTLKREPVTWAVLVFTAWQLFVSALHSRELTPLALGLTIQLRLGAVYMAARILAYYKPPEKRLVQKLVVVPAIGVILFGLLQVFVLPYDFLRHFGYNKETTIPPYFTIDAQLSKLRIASTLRGPNPLGVYLILPLMFFAKELWQKSKNTVLYGVLFVAGCVVMYHSQSRGAWLGFAVALCVWAALSLSKKARLIAVAATVVLAMVTGAALYSQRHTSFVEDVVLHDNPQEGGPVSSNTGHLESLKAGVSDVRSRPLTGCGVGCAGPASFRSKNGARIAENYYLQTAQESGLIGLLLLLALFGLVGRQLLRTNADTVNRALFATFVGVCVASLLAHAWADDTIAYTWWALAGLVMYTEHKQVTKKQSYGTQKTTKSI